MTEDVLALPTDSFAIKRQFFQDVGGLNETFGDEYSFVDFCMRMKEKGKRVIYTSKSIAFNFDDMSEEDDSYSFSENVPASIFSQR